MIIGSCCGLECSDCGAHKCGAVWDDERKPNVPAQDLGSLGGKKSAESRLGGKTREEISEAMRELRRIALTKAGKNDMN